MAVRGPGQAQAARFRRNPTNQPRKEVMIMTSTRTSRPAAAPAYYLGRPAELWLSYATRRRTPARMRSERDA